MLLRLQTTSVSCVPAPLPYPTLRSSFDNSRRLVTRGQICTRDGTVATSAGSMIIQRPALYSSFDRPHIHERASLRRQHNAAIVQSGPLDLTLHCLMRPFTATTVLLQPAGAGSNRHALWVEAGLNGIPANGSVDASLYASGHPSLSAAALRLHEGRWKRRRLGGIESSEYASRNVRVVWSTHRIEAACTSMRYSSRLSCPANGRNI
ncbi:hypothetical protein HDV63DRAFT_192574 [Trichoderma sp. SZMC 28014]